MITRDPEKTKNMMTVGELKAILQNHSDDTPIAVSVRLKSLQGQFHQINVGRCMN